MPHTLDVDAVSATVNEQQLTLNVLQKIKTEDVSREDIFFKLRGKVTRGDTIKILNEVDADCLVKKNPIMYSRVKLAESLSSTIEQSLKRDRAIASIDASLDPSLSNFVQTKSYKQLLRRMAPEHPLNVFVWGETGAGKSSAILHIAKSQGRSAVRVNLSKFSDVDDLFGGMRITDGTTYFDEGPVLIAMRAGAILILDEVDSADPQLLTDLHPVLERRGYLVKKLKKMVYPAPGFCVIATANTKGGGDLSGKYIGATALNRAFLDRFAVGINYDTPTRGELLRIINGSVANVPVDVAHGLADWYESIDKAVKHHVIEEHISTRKILDIAKIMVEEEIDSPSNKNAKAIILEATNLMDSHISIALTELWDSLAAPS